MIDNAYASKPITVTEANRKLKQAITENTGTIYVIGEISGYRPSSSGHAYFTLKDGESGLPSLVFRSQTDTIGKVRNGLKVVATGRFNLYEKTGNINFIVSHIEPAGEGTLQMEIEMRKARYQAMGWFDPARKKQLPESISRIGVVTSATGAVFHDILNVTRRRAPEIDILLYPSPVQGKGAEDVIASRIRQANDDGLVDVLIVGRGGGSLEDLLPYSMDPVIQAIHDSHIPIISAVGHDVDWPISDYVADMRAGTPSIAGEKVSETAFRRREMFQTVVSSIQMQMKNRILMADSRLLANRIDKSIIMQKLNALQMRFEKSRNLHDVLVRRVDEAEWRLDVNSRELADSCREFIVHCESRCRLAASELEALNPTAILSRGYAAVFNDGGHVVKSVNDVSGDDNISIRLADGTIRAVVAEK